MSCVTVVSMFRLHLIHRQECTTDLSKIHTSIIGMGCKQLVFGLSFKIHTTTSCQLLSPSPKPKPWAWLKLNVLSPLFLLTALIVSPGPKTLSPGTISPKRNFFFEREERQKERRHERNQMVVCFYSLCLKSRKSYAGVVFEV